MPTTVFGLPAHPLIVHATVVLVPAAALAVLVAALWPRFRAWAGWGPLALAVVALVLTPLSTSSGENLEKQVGGGKLVERHSELADMLLWWTIPLAVVAAALYFLLTFRKTHARTADGERTGASGSGAVRIGLGVLGVVVGIGTLVQVVLIGHSGAEAVWKGGDSAATVSVTLPLAG